MQWTATFTPKSLADNAQVNETDGVGYVSITNISRDGQTGIVTFDLKGVTVSPLNGVEIEVSSGPALEVVHATVVVPHSVASPPRGSDSSVQATAKRIKINAQSAPADHAVNNPPTDPPTFALLESVMAVSPLMIPVLDQHGRPLVGWDGATVTEKSGGSFYSLNVTLNNAGEYPDNIGVRYRKAVDPNPTNDPTIIANFMAGTPDDPPASTNLPKKTIELEIDGWPVEGGERSVNIPFGIATTLEVDW